MLLRIDVREPAFFLYGPTVPPPGVMVVELLPRVATTVPTTTPVTTMTVPVIQTFFGMWRMDLRTFETGAEGLSGAAGVSGTMGDAGEGGGAAGGAPAPPAPPAILL